VKLTHDQVHQIMTARCPGDDIVHAARLRREAEAAVQRRQAADQGGQDLREAA
jgi:hypothetical protein